MTLRSQRLHQALPGLLLSGLLACTAPWKGPLDDRPREVGEICIASSPLVESCHVGIGACKAEGRPACVNREVVCPVEALTEQPERCGPTPVDDDCDGTIDEHLICCDPAAGALEVCNATDDDCDGAIDEQLSDRVDLCDGFDDDCDGEVDEDAVRDDERCNALDDDCDGRVDEGVEVCNLEDDDCDGAIDEGLVERCNGADDDCDGALDEDLAGTPERCNAADDDCDGLADEDFEALGEPCRAGMGVCSALGEQVCGLDGGLICSATPASPAATDATCNGFDEDCDGRADEDPPCDGVPLVRWIPGPDFDSPQQAAPHWVVIPASVYTRGVAPDHPDLDMPDGWTAEHEGPPHRVSLSTAFAIASNEVTIEQWEAIVGSHPALREGCPTCPVDRVSWYEAVRFANLLTARQWPDEPQRQCYTLEGCQGEDDFGKPCRGNRSHCQGAFICERVTPVAACEGYRLPTEAEWEMAARGGTETLYWFGDRGDDVGRFEQCDVGHAQTVPYEPFPTNPFGLRHMLGNVAEWVFDGWGRYTPESDPWVDPVILDPAANIDEAERMTRGGFPEISYSFCRSTSRIAEWPGVKYRTIGFRLARTIY